jgi:carboxyvinyl-carboxyphosphonate phosphorylmutase
MYVTERRTRYRAILAGNDCIQPASVFDPLSARYAEQLGFEVAVLAGSVASAVVLGTPDLTLLSLPEFAGLARRITRASDISLMVDADNGYGNALGVMRTVEEMEAAGVAALSIEDSDLPARFVRHGGERMVDLAEMVGKLRAAVRARGDPTLVVTARTRALRVAGLTECIERVKAYEQAGVDAIGLKSATLEDVAAVHAVTALPLLIGSTSNPTDLRQLAACGVRIASPGNLAFQAAAQASYQALRDLRTAPAGLTRMSDGQ